MEYVKTWLSSNGLGEYWPNFEKHGWDELSLLTKMSDKEIEECIKKAGHRAKFREALKYPTFANAVSHSVASESKCTSDEHQGERTNIAAPFLPVISEATAQLRDNDRTETTESRTIDSGVDRRKPAEIIQEQDHANTGPINTTGDVERADIDEAAGGVVDVLGVIEDNQTEPRTIYRGDDRKEPIETAPKQGTTDTDVTNAADEVDRADIDEAAGGVVDVSVIIDDNRAENESKATSSVITRNEVSQFGETILESSDSNMSMTTELSTEDQSYTVIDGTVLRDAGSQLMNRGSPHLTIIGRSENTTVNQGPIQLYAAPEADETNNPIAILKGQMEMLADSYRSKDCLFVETKAFHELKSVVEDMHWATLLGKPGDGKSATAAHLLLQYTDRGYEPVFLSSPRDWKMLITDDTTSRQVVVIDDIFGQSYLDDNNNVGKWKSLIESMSRIVKQRNGNLVVICTSRRYIFKDIETALSKYACFLKHATIDMTEEQFKLKGGEKVAIFTKFAEAHTIETDQLLLSDIRYVDPPHGFPHCVELYCTNTFLRKEGIAFFENPEQYVQREICNFKDNDRVKFLVLLLVLHKGGNLGTDLLDRLTENTTDDDKKFFQTAGVSLETAIPDIHRALTGLTNTYLKRNQDGSYSFSHHSLKETVAFIYISANPSHAIRALEFQHIVAFTNTKKETTKGTASRMLLPFEPLAKRMISEIEDGHAIVCDCEVWNDMTFVSMFLKCIEKEQVTFLETVICSELAYMSYSYSLLVGLIRKRRHGATIAILENETIQKTLQNSDKWLDNLQEGLEKACSDTESNTALVEALVTYRSGENRLKLDWSKLLSEMLSHSKADEAIILIDNTHINPQYVGNGTFFHALACSSIDQPQFETLCKKLLGAGVDINGTDKDDIPAVFYCLTRDNGWNRLLCMVNYGANIQKKCKQGNLVTFVVNNTNLNASSKLCILTRLSDFDVDFHCKDSNGSNAIHLMCQREPDEGSFSLLECLLKKDINTEAVNGRGVVPLMFALKNNLSIDIIRTLAMKSPLCHVDKFGQGYFHYLMSSMRIRDIDEFCYKCEILLKLGSSINEKDNADKTPIVYLMEQCKITQIGPDLVKGFQFLQENGIDLHAKDERGRNIVLCVLDWKLTKNVIPLLQYFDFIGLDLKLTDNDGRNALHHLFANVVYNDHKIGHTITKREFPEASGNMLKDVYDFLTNDIGVFPTIADKNGINPVMLALENCAGFSWISDLLKLDLPLQSDDKGRNYFHYLAKSRAPDDKFETLKAMLLDKGLIEDNTVLRHGLEQMLMHRPKQKRTVCIVS